MIGGFSSWWRLIRTADLKERERTRRRSPSILPMGRSWWLAGAAAALVLLGCGRADDLGTSAPAVSDRDEPVISPDPASDPSTATGRPRFVTPQPGTADPRPRPFQEAVPVGERELAVRWWGEVAPCDVLDRVEVVEQPDQVRLTLFVGYDPARSDVACIELAVWYETKVVLATPLADRRVSDGAA